MSETADIAGRLRASNPVPALPRGAPPADVLAQITATPRRGPATRPSTALIRRPLLAACLALLALGGIALAASITVRYFDEAGAKPLPSSVRKSLVFATAHVYPTDRLALDDTVTAYVFTTRAGEGSVYMAPYLHRQGFCAALALPGKPVQAGCALGGAVAALSAGEYQPWDFALTPDVHALLGRLSPGAAGDRVEIGFEDGASEPAPMHGRWFAYAAAGQRTEAGHRPSELTVLRGDRVIRREPLLPTGFNTLAAARALVPAGDGSRGQSAIRRYLLERVESRSSDGGDMASHTDISRTALVASLALGSGVRVSVYAAPVRRFHGTTETILIGLDNRYPRRPIMTFSGVDAPRGSGFESAGSCRCAAPNSAWSFSFLYGTVPLGVSHVSVRTGGREHAANLFDGGRQWVWIGLAQRPDALVGRAASGKVIATKRLRQPH